jgi:hypothetical protein
MLAALTQQLIDQKTPYDTSLRDSFQRLLAVDFLPLLRVSRYELTKLSLFGFDIYVPLLLLRSSPSRQSSRSFPGSSSPRRE